MENELIIETSASRFNEDVLERSKEMAVLVDFWAEWCGPCRSIAPLLVQLAEELVGKLCVVKVDTDAEAELAGQYGIRSLPTLMIFRNGQAVEQIIGAQPLAAIRAAVDQFLPRASEGALEQAKAFTADGQVDDAISLLQVTLESEPDDYRIHPNLCELLIQKGDLVAAEALINDLPANIVEDKAMAPIRARLKLARVLGDDFDEVTVRKLADGDADSNAHSNKIEALYQLSVWSALEGDYDASMDGLLSLLLRHRDWREGAIQKTIIDIFNTIDNGDSRLKGYRTRLARTLN